MSKPPTEKPAAAGGGTLTAVPEPGITPAAGGSSAAGKALSTDEVVAELEATGKDGEQPDDGEVKAKAKAKERPRFDYEPDWPAELAEAMKKAFKNLFNVTANYNILKIEQLEKELAALPKEISELNQRLSDLPKQISESKEKISALEKDMQDPAINPKKLQDMQKEMKLLKKALAKQEKQQASLAKKIDKKEKEIVLKEAERELREEIWNIHAHSSEGYMKKCTEAKYDVPELDRKNIAKKLDTLTEKYKSAKWDTKSAPGKALDVVSALPKHLIKAGGSLVAKPFKFAAKKITEAFTDKAERDAASHGSGAAPVAGAEGEKPNPPAAKVDSANRSPAGAGLPDKLAGVGQAWGDAAAAGPNPDAKPGGPPVIYRPRAGSLPPYLPGDPAAPPVPKPAADKKRRSSLP